MAQKTTTSTNSQLAIAVAGVFPSAVNIQQYAVDDAFATEAIKPSEMVIGVDGFAAAGYTPELVKLKITLLPTSISKQFFDVWFAAMQSNREVSYANAWLLLPSTNESYAFKKGTLTSYPIAPAGKKVLQHVEYEITFESVTVGTY
jgi:hypothetical protein